MSITPLLRLGLKAAAVTVILGTASVPTAAQPRTDHAAKLDDGARARARQLAGRSRVIVQFAGEPDVRVITRERGTPGRRLGTQRAQVAEIDNHAIAAMAADPRVVRIVIDRPAYALLERTSAAVGAALAREQYDLSGVGVGVAVIDSGIDGSHNDLDAASGRSRFRTGVTHFKDFTTDGSPSSSFDDFGHGTHVAGTIAGNGHDSDGRRAGVAPGAHLISLKVLDAEGRGYISDVISALDYAVAIKEAYNIRVINLSVGAGVTESYLLDPLTLAAKRAVDAGIVVVAAAGNLGRDDHGRVQYGGITAPGNAPWVLTVGAASHEGTAHRHDDVVSGFSSRGPTWIDFAAKPDLVAPGVGIESLAAPGSTLYELGADYLLDGTRPARYKPYLSLSGTSMATPVVAGTIALMLEANPRLTPNAVKALLQYTAEARDGASALVQGAGLLNARGAIRMARFFARPQRGLGAPADEIEGGAAPWSRQLLWGNYRVAGGVPLPGSNAWLLGTTWGAMQTSTGRSITWGARANDSDNIVWSTARGGDGDNIVWSTARGGDGDNIVWSTARGGDGDNIVWSTARGGDGDNIVWSTARGGDGDNIVWSTARGGDGDNIVWSTARGGDGDNIVWSTASIQNVVWGTDCGGRNCPGVVWGAQALNGAVWGTARTGDNIVWSTGRGGDGDNIVWSTGRGGDGDNIVWSTGAAEQVLWPADSSTSPINRRRSSSGTH